MNESEDMTVRRESQSEFRGSAERHYDLTLFPFTEYITSRRDCIKCHRPIRHLMQDSHSSNEDASLKSNFNNFRMHIHNSTKTLAQ